jgi:hypothetical protein
MSDKFELELQTLFTEEQFRKAKRLCHLKGVSMAGFVRNLIAQEVFHSEYFLCQFQQSHKVNSDSDQTKHEEQDVIEGM